VNVQGFNKELAASLQELNELLKNDEVPEAFREKCSEIMEEDIPESLKFILSSTLKMDGLLSGLLTLSRIGRQDVQIKKLNMNKLVKDVAAEFEFKIRTKNVKLDLGKLPECNGDNSQINRVFSNLVGNALKFLDSSRPGIIKISGRKENKRIFYYIEDNGIGIETEHQKKIFDIFHQLEPKEPGIGLGLTITKQILERNNGTIRVDSTPGKGTKFIISLPDNPKHEFII